MLKTANREPLVRNLTVAVVLAVAAALLPLAGFSNYFLGQVTLLFIWACVASQWNLVFGVAGIMSLGHVAVFAFGAYATAMAATYLPVPFWASFLMGAPAAMLFSLLMGFLTLRMRGEYVAIVTFAIALLMSSIVINDVGCFRTIDMICYNLTGGTRGLANYGSFGWTEILGFKYRYFGDYYVALAALFIGVTLSILVIFGPFGLAFRAIRDNELYARSRGVNFRKYQLLVFMIAGFSTGLAGSVYAAYVKTVGPTILHMDLLIFLLSIMIVGGRGSTWGPLIGAVALMFADSIFQSYGAWRTAGLALITILFILLYPKGLGGLVENLGAKLVAPFSRKQGRLTVAREVQSHV
jgi:branched-chain amino acid transport system permease protein